VRQAEDSVRWMAAGSPPSSVLASDVLNALLNDWMNCEAERAVSMIDCGTCSSVPGVMSCP